VSRGNIRSVPRSEGVNGSTMDFEGMTGPEVDRMVKALLVYTTRKLRRRWFSKTKPDPMEYVSEAMIRVERGKHGHTKRARARNYDEYPSLEAQLRSVIDSLISDDVRGSDNKNIELLDEDAVVADRRPNPEAAVATNERLERFFDNLTELALEAPENDHLVAVVEMMWDEHTMKQSDWVERLGIDRSAANNLKKRLDRLMVKAKEAVDADE